MVTQIQNQSFLPEIVVNFCSHLPDAQLPLMKTIDKNFCTIIQNDTSLQTKVAHLYLLKNQHRANIPLERIKYMLSGGDLTVEIDGDLNLFHFTKSLTPTLPWITHLILNKCSSSSLVGVFELLKSQGRLTKLCLSDCTLDSATISELMAVHSLKIKAERAFTIYMCQQEIKNDPDLFDVQERLGIQWVSNEDAEQYQIKNPERRDAGVSDLVKFKMVVENCSSSTNDVLNAFDSIEVITKLGLVSSLWYRAIMDRNKVEMAPVDQIYKKVRTYIEDNPHHQDLSFSATANMPAR